MQHEAGLRRQREHVRDVLLLRIHRRRLSSCRLLGGGARERRRSSVGRARPRKNSDADMRRWLPKSCPKVIEELLQEPRFGQNSTQIGRDF